MTHFITLNALKLEMRLQSKYRGRYRGFLTKNILL